MAMEEDEAIGAVVTPRTEQVVDFDGDGIPVAATPDGEPYVALRPITDHLGLDSRSQRRRAQADPVIAPRLRTLTLTAADGRRRDLLCLPLDLLPGYLFGIDTGRVKAALVDKLNRYRADCFRVLWEAFRGEAWAVRDVMVPSAPSEASAGPSTPGVSGAALALEIATAVQHLARNQVEIEQRLADVAGRQDVMADYLRGFIADTSRRLTDLERATGGEATITDGQATEISLAVKAIGQRLQAGGHREGYAQVYAAIYRRYRINTYKALPARAYDEVAGWLHRWYLEVAPPEASGEPGEPTEGE
jgi:hypothetical protein